MAKKTYPLDYKIRIIEEVIFKGYGSTKRICEREGISPAAVHSWRNSWEIKNVLLRRKSVKFLRNEIKLLNSKVRVQKIKMNIQDTIIEILKIYSGIYDRELDEI